MSASQLLSPSDDSEPASSQAFVIHVGLLPIVLLTLGRSAMCAPRQRVPVV